jgi:hypothetical protein
VKVPFRAAFGCNHELQMLNYINRHETFKHLSELIDELRAALDADESSDEEEPRMGVQGGS